MGRSRDRRINARIKRLAWLASTDAKERFEPELQQLGKQWIREARRRANNLNAPSANSFADAVGQEVFRLGIALAQETEHTAAEQKRVNDELARVRGKCDGTETSTLTQPQLRRLRTVKSTVAAKANKAAQGEFTNLKAAKKILVNVAKPAALAVQHIVINTISKDAKASIG